MGRGQIEGSQKWSFLRYLCECELARSGPQRIICATNAWTTRSFLSDTLTLKHSDLCGAWENVYLEIYVTTSGSENAPKKSNVWVIMRESLACDVISFVIIFRHIDTVISFGFAKCQQFHCRKMLFKRI